MALDEENLGTGFHDYELDDALADAATSQSAPLIKQGTSGQDGENLREEAQSQPRALRSRANMDDLDDDVPRSLLIEDENHLVPVVTARQSRVLPPPIPGPASRGTRAKWQTAQEQQQLHQERPPRQAQIRVQHRHGHPISMMDPKQKAMWMWANVENLDNFLQDVYDYFVGNGIWCIFLSRLLSLLYVDLEPNPDN